MTVSLQVKSDLPVAQDMSDGLVGLEGEARGGRRRVGGAMYQPTASGNRGFVT